MRACLGHAGRPSALLATTNAFSGGWLWQKPQSTWRRGDTTKNDDNVIFHNASWWPHPDPPQSTAAADALLKPSVPSAAFVAAPPSAPSTPVIAAQPSAPARPCAPSPAPPAAASAAAAARAPKESAAWSVDGRVGGAKAAKAVNSQPGGALSDLKRAARAARWPPASSVHTKPEPKPRVSVMQQRRAMQAYARQVADANAATLPPPADTQPVRESNNNEGGRR